mmetsp:Transcript_62488/g.116131  ORF Transcript_62488/g.116131 Transcript_62488/m.116131 type:complete len:226 (+) Transcript_62488:1866-2543(+)
MYGSCSICRKELGSKDIQPVEKELKVPQAQSPSSSSDGDSSTVATGGCVLQVNQRYERHGTKLAALISKLKQLREVDKCAKVILFVQFDELKRKVASALLECGIPSLVLQGSVAQRAKIIHDWQNNPTSLSFVLLLSLAQSASGTNLTAANHVVFLHPMLASTHEQAVSFEMQAIGRARRHGQLRDVVHVWRFVTLDTVEQHMSEKHQANHGADVMVEHAASTSR